MLRRAVVPSPPTPSPDFVPRGGGGAGDRGFGSFPRSAGHAWSRPIPRSVRGADFGHVYDLDTIAGEAADTKGAPSKGEFLLEVLPTDEVAGLHLGEAAERLSVLFVGDGLGLDLHEEAGECEAVHTGWPKLQCRAL